MAHELIYTSAPRGLFPGQFGFCTVAATPGLPESLREKLEALSRYRHEDSMLVGRSPRNRVIFSHYQIKINSTVWHVLSQICDAGLDYSGRHNFLAHHLALSADELPGSGPGWVLQQDSFFMREWDGRPTLLEPRHIPTVGRMHPRPCSYWERLTGDAGWAGTIAASPYKTWYVVVKPDHDALLLFSEVLALLPIEEQWQITFSTRYLGPLAGTRCLWRAVTRNSPEFRDALSTEAGRRVLEIDRLSGIPPQSEEVEAARRGSLLRKPDRSTKTRRITAPKLLVPNRSTQPSPRAMRHNTGTTTMEMEEAMTNVPGPAEDAGAALKVLLGVALGASLASAFLFFIELLTGASGLRHMNVRGRHELALLERVNTLQDELSAEGEGNNRLQQKLTVESRQRRALEEKFSALTKEMEAFRRQNTVLAQQRDMVSESLRELQDRVNDLCDTWSDSYFIFALQESKQRNGVLRIGDFPIILAEDSVAIDFLGCPSYARSEKEQDRIALFLDNKKAAIVRFEGKNRQIVLEQPDPDVSLPSLPILRIFMPLSVGGNITFYLHSWSQTQTVTTPINFAECAKAAFSNRRNEVNQGDCLLTKAFLTDTSKANNEGKEPTRFYCAEIQDHFSKDGDLRRYLTSNSPDDALVFSNKLILQTPSKELLVAEIPAGTGSDRVALAGNGLRATIRLHKVDSDQAKPPEWKLVLEVPDNRDKTPGRGWCLMEGTIGRRVPGVGVEELKVQPFLRIQVNEKPRQEGGLKAK